MSTMVQRSEVAQASVPGQRHGDPFAAQLAAAFTRLRPAFDPDPAARARSRARLTAYLQARGS